MSFSRPGIPFRDWRWCWLSVLIGVLSFAVLAVPIAVFYYPALAVVAATDWLTGRIARLHVRLLNADKARMAGRERAA